MEELILYLGCENEIQLLRMVLDENNQQPLIAEIRELFEQLDLSKKGEYQIV